MLTTNLKIIILMIFKNLKTNKILSHNFIPSFKNKIFTFFKLDINKFRLNIGIRSEDYFQACKELSIIKTDNRNKYYL